MATTTLDDALTKAIAAHDEWRARLRLMISTGATGIDARAVRRDEDCDLGKWLHSRQAKGRGAPHGTELGHLHARFHEAAARVVELVDERRRAEALAATGPNGEFTLAADDLRKALAESSASA